ncbi:Ras-related protein Rab-11A [Tritrichomonas foetus]|uniref:Ras-related protein Rab-11A n=1 Tax=Tritrichomonas foetus TaxID=1144522 RepID=A0A1J4JGN5_9EUKA|nr:Ras-related protein Rab-11A [Tritrichomonas foetus]|eukprot:OHS97463.1 Ras-related protein Rab-11A [Tritrichomonas foetus]
MAEEDLKFKIVFVGDTTVGKTSLIHRFLNLDPVNASTTGATSTRAETQVDGKTVILNVWDTAGQETFRNLVPIYAKGSHAAIIVFDQTNQATYDHVDGWYSYIREQVGDKTIICLAANKSDLPPVVPTETALSWAAEHNVEMMRTSAADGTNVETLFETVSRLLVKQNEEEAKAAAEKKKKEAEAQPVNIAGEEKPSKKSDKKKDNCCN